MTPITAEIDQIGCRESEVACCNFLSYFARDRFWVCPQSVFADSHSSAAIDCVKS